MAKRLQLRRGTTANHGTFTGAVGEITIDTDKDVVVVHDGATAGGFPLAKQTSVNSKVTLVTSTDNAIVRFDGTTGEVQNSGVIITDNGSVLVTSSTGLLGYGTGAGGTVTQLTSKSTAVTLNKPTGQINMNNATLAAGASVTFQLTNSIIYSVYVLNINAYNNLSYRVESVYTTNGGAGIRVTNITASALSEELVLTYAILKGANS